MESRATAFNAKEVLGKETHSHPPSFLLPTLTRILSLDGSNRSIQKVGSFLWPNDLVSLHYADDTLILVSRDARSLISLKLLLYAYEMMTGLKINFYKSFIYNLNRCDEIGTRAAIILNCNLGTLPFTYLGLPIKVTSLSREDWQPLIERVEKKLATWKGNTLSRGGILILVNSVLSSSLYFMS